MLLEASKNYHCAVSTSYGEYEKLSLKSAADIVVVVIAVSPAQ